MGVIDTVVTGVAALVGAVTSRLAYDELKAWSPRLVCRLVQRAVMKLPEVQRERMAEEWASHVADTPGEMGKLLAAIGFNHAANTQKRAFTRKMLFRLFFKDLDEERLLLMTFLYRCAEEVNCLSDGRYGLEIAKAVITEINVFDLFALRADFIRAYLSGDKKSVIEKAFALSFRCSRGKILCSYFNETLHIT